MDAIVIAASIGLWIALVVAAAIVPLVGPTGADRNGDPLALPHRHDDKAGGTRAA